jgi:hypothetical protein
MATSSAPTGDGIVPEDHPPQDGALASESDSAESAAGREQEEEEEAGQEEEEEDEEEASDEDDAAFDASLAHAGSVSLPALHCLGANSLRCNDFALRCAAIKSSSIGPMPVPRTVQTLRLPLLLLPAHLFPTLAHCFPGAAGPEFSAASARAV